VIFQKIVFLHIAECYGEEGAPLNIFRSILFSFQAIAFVVAVVISLLYARFFIRYALAVEKYDVDEPTGLIKHVMRLYDKYYKPVGEIEEVDGVDRRDDEAEEVSIEEEAAVDSEIADAARVDPLADEIEEAAIED